MRRASLLALLLFAPLSALCSDYKLTVGDGSATVELSVKRPSKVFRMPAWIPGDYDLANYGRVVVDPQFFAGDRKVKAAQGDDGNSWIIAEGATRVVYGVKPSAGNFGPNLQIRGEETFISGGGVFGYFEGHSDESVSLSLPGKVYTELKGEGARWSAQNYDELIDSPIVIGPNVKVGETLVRGKRHGVVAFGRNENADVDGFAKLGGQVAEQCFLLFGELPYDSYTFFLDFGGRGGGLEHRNGTRIGISANAVPERSVGILFHEYFHCFNVKRIRAKVLGPFDYSKPAVTGTLWWLEGVTDYYASKLAVRAQLETREGLLGEAGRSAFQMNRPAYQRVSADESSRRVWEVHGSQGYGMSYYSKGWAIGFFLDMAIMGETHGRKSLDDVMKALWKETKPPKPGYRDERLRELVVETGGEKCGGWYDTVVQTTNPMPWEAVLPEVGLTLQERSISVADPKPLERWP
ncbi:MAG: M61 family metallopeptidase [Armatimonadetes bacterium]|nr:M61 family metallopeptidase [Armatimonadota bacterium]